jgi:hypothetical protein
LPGTFGNMYENRLVLMRKHAGHGNG